MQTTGHTVHGARDADHLSALAHRIYDASVEPQQWNSVVAEIAASFGARRALLFTPFLAPQHGGLIFPLGFTEADLQLWATTYIEQDLWAIHSTRKGLFRTGLVSLDDEMVPREAFLASSFYRDFLKKIGIGRVCAGVVFGGSPDLPGMVLSVYRAQQDAAFDQHDKRWMKLLLSHVSRAMGIMQRLDTARAQSASLLASFDRLKFGVVLLNEAMRVLHLNQAAQAVLKRDDALRLSASRHLISHHGAHSRSLTQWLTSVRDAPLPEQEHFLDGFTVTRAAGGERRHYAIQCAPVPAAGAWHTQQETVRYALFITDPATVHLPGVSRLSHLYGLTNTQARIAREFANGGTYKAVAQRLHISEETVRGHIKEIYPKLRVNRLADLVRIVLSLGQSRV